MVDTKKYPDMKYYYKRWCRKMKKIRKFGFCILAFLLLITSLFTGCELVHVDKPRVKEGRFNFSVTYEINGKEETIAGVYVCKFKKATASISGWWREWDTYIEGTDMKEEVVLFTTEDGRINLDLGLDAFYFMSDPFYDGGELEPAFYIYYSEKKREETGGDLWSYDVDLLLNCYGVRIISYEYDEPIENVYE